MGQLALTGIRPAKRAVPRIGLRITVTATGQVEVRLQDKGTGKSEEAELGPVEVQEG
jgi:molecular chaperone DnaK (HSP70)